MKPLDVRAARENRLPRLAEFHGAGCGLHEERMRAAVINHRVLKAGAQLRQIGTDFDAVAQPRGLELLLHGCYRHHPLVCVPQVLPRFLRLHGSRLEQENARDDLQAVGDAVLLAIEDITQRRERGARKG